MSNYAIAASVRLDCEELLRRFQATNSVRFEVFCAVWRDMKFSFILRNGLKEKLMFSFIEECLLISLSFCDPMHPFQHRTAGLYLLYGFYFKQAGSFQVKIRITMQQWKDLMNFIEEAKSESHHDIHYIFQKLVFENAFHFVASPRELAPFYREVGTTEAENSYSLHSSLKEFIDEGNFLHLDSIHEHYLAMKKQVLPEGDVNNIAEDFSSSIEKQYREFEVNRMTKLVKGRRTTESTKKDIGERRLALKSSSMGQTGTTSRSRRHRNVEVDKESDIKESPTKRKIFAALQSTEPLSAPADSMEIDESAENSNWSMDMPTLTIDESSHPSVT